jgi:hypothetical protein
MKLNEQVSTQTDIDLLKQAVSNKCMPTWLTDGKIGKTKSGKTVWYGKSSKGSTVIFFPPKDGVLTAKNLKTKKISTKKCVLPSVDSTANPAETQQKLTDYQQKSLDNLIKNSKTSTGEPLYQMEKPTLDIINNFEEVKVNTLPGFEKDNIPENIVVWKRKDVVNAQSIESADTNEIIRKLNRYVKQKNYNDRAFCANFIGDYNELRKLNTKVTEKELFSWKDGIKACNSRFKFYFTMGMTKNQLEKISNDKGSFGIPDLLGNKSDDENSDETNTENSTRKAMTESQQLLKNIVKENLEKTAISKRKKIISEEKIINQRFMVIAENAKFNTKKQKEQFFKNLLSEINDLNNQNYSKELINEGFWDMLKSIFGYGADSIIPSFKEFLVKLIVKKLTPIDPDGWFGQFISTSIGNLNISDISKLTDCKFLSKFLTKSVVETVLAKMQPKVENADAIITIIRNGVMDAIDDTQLAQNIENGIASFICPSLKNVNTKMSNLVDKTKETLMSGTQSALQPIQSKT